MVQPVPPPAASGGGSGGTGGGGGVRGPTPPPKSDQPPRTGATAAPLDPTAAAGVDLAKLVLKIATGSIILLIAYLVVMDIVVANNVRYAYEQVLNSSRVGSELYTLDSFKRLEKGLADLQDDPSKTMSPDDLQKSKALVAMLGNLPSLTSAQKTLLDYCVSSPPSTDASRVEKLNGCQEILTRITRAALEAAASSVNAQVAGESANKINEQRQALHSFWIQAAQLILLNLLLPLLTALFGYIFGTQQRHGMT